MNTLHTGGFFSSLKILKKLLVKPLRTKNVRGMM